MTRVEFWPDYGSGPLWTEDGAPIDPRSLGLTDDLAEQLELWNAQYDEDRIPVEGSGDREWLDRGAHLSSGRGGRSGPRARSSSPNRGGTTRRMFDGSVRDQR